MSEEQNQREFVTLAELLADQAKACADFLRDNDDLAKEGVLEQFRVLRNKARKTANDWIKLDNPV